MRLNELVIGTGNIITHGVATVAGIDAVNNAVQGNYKVAAVEAIISVGIEFSKYLDRKKQRVVADFCNGALEHVARMNRINQQLPNYQR